MPPLFVIDHIWSSLSQEWVSGPRRYKVPEGPKYLKGPKFNYKVEFFRLGANRSNLISLPQQQLGAIEKVTKIKTDVKVGIGKSNTCV